MEIEREIEIKARLDTFETIERLSKANLPIPLDLEKQALLFHLQDYPERHDLKLRLIRVHHELGEPVPTLLLNDVLASRLDLTAVLSSIRDGTASRDKVLRAVDEVLVANETMPLELEAASLHFHIEADQTRIDLKQRLVSVMNMIGRPAPRDILDEVQKSFLADERSTDFQAQIEDYATKVGNADMEANFLSAYSAISGYTVTPIARLYALWEAVAYIVSADIAGSIVECGVWRGGSMMLAAKSLMESRTTDRDIYLYDTFEGLPRPDDALDTDILGNRAIDGWIPRRKSDESSAWAYCDEAEVRRNLASTAYPESRIKLIKGLVENTIPETAPPAISLLRIDTDWYVSYKHVLQHLYDRVSIGGVIIFDDYGHFLGAKKAVDDFIHDRNIKIFLMRVDYSCRLAIKP